MRAKFGYKRRPVKYGIKPAIVAASQLQQAGLDLAAVINRYSRKVLGWSMHSRMQPSLALNALLMAIRQRKQLTSRGSFRSRFTIYKPRVGEFLTNHNLEASMSRRGNCYDKAVAESFFHLLKTERLRRKTYKTSQDARQDVFDYIELFYNPKRRDAVTR